MYGYLSQIINFIDIELEKNFIFLKYLNSNLPKRKTTTFYFENSIDLDSLRIQKIYEKVESPTPVTQVVSPPSFSPGGVEETKYDLLSDLIIQVNQTYGGMLNDEDKVQLARFNEKLELDEEVKMYMKGNNSEVNKKNFFSKKCNEVIIDDIDNSAVFYEKINSNKSMKDLVFRLLYENYQNKSVR